MTQHDPSQMRDCDEILARLSESGLPLPDPFPEYVACPHCGEAEVEVWCYQAGVHCHTCGGWIDHARPACFDCPNRCQHVMSDT
ncbi:MAG TPA: hypothetical protein VIK33_01505 [Anaerolineae bacterium]